MKHTMVWFGNMSFDFLKNGEMPIAIVNSIDEKAIMNPDDVDEYMTSNGYDSYLIPDEFKGEIAFSVEFFKGLT